MNAQGNIDQPHHDGDATAEIEDYDPTTVDEACAMSRLTGLVDEYRQHQDYESIQEDYCEVSMQLNEFRCLAPAFRERPKVPLSAKDRKPGHLKLHRDQVVIDCHWLRCTGATVWARDREYQPLFDRDLPFDDDLAERFASRNWKASHRVDEALGLTRFQQAQLATLRGQQVRTLDRHANYGTGKGASRVPARMGALQRTLNRWCEQDKRLIPQRKVYERLWMARELLGLDGSGQQIASLAAMMDGSTALHSKTALDKLAKLDMRLVVVMPS